jgi:hypothetical protein
LSQDQSGKVVITRRRKKLASKYQKQVKPIGGKEE